MSLGIGIMAENKKVKSNDEQKSVTIKKIAMMDVEKVVSKAASVQKLKAERVKKEKELERWLENAKKQIEKPDSKDYQAKLIKRYEQEYKDKKEKLILEFQKNLKEVNKNVTNQIVNAVKENN